jgi:putative hydrolase of the HAD superfamily
VASRAPFNKSLDGMDTQLRYPKAIVFDLWYTLICPEHHRPPGVRSIDAIPAVLNLEPQEFAGYWNAHLPAMYSDPRPLREYIADYVSGLGRTLSEAEFAAFDNVWSAHDAALGSPRPQVLSALSRLAAGGVRLGLLSNAHEREIRCWHASPFSSFFEVASFSCHIGRAKPQAGAYRQVLEALGVRPEDALYMGDGASDELRGARDLGFGTVVFMRGLLKELQVRGSEYAMLAGQAHFVVDSVEEMANVIPARCTKAQGLEMPSTSGSSGRGEA